MQLGGKLLKVHYPKLTVMRGVEHTVSIFLIMFQNTHCLYTTLFRSYGTDRLEIVDCQGHLARGNKKDASFICNRFLKHMK